MKNAIRGRLCYPRMPSQLCHLFFGYFVERALSPKMHSSLQRIQRDTQHPVENIGALNFQRPNLSLSPATSEFHMVLAAQWSPHSDGSA